MTAPVLEARGLVKTFGATRALSGVDLALPDAAFVALLGPAGAGKTTALRILAGLEPPDSGRVAIRGVDATAFEPKDRDVAMIFDSLALYPDKTGFENIASPLRIRRTDSAAVATRVEAVASTLRVRHILDRLPRTMSGGERQRIALGRALVREPAFFLLDEPLSSLDAQLRVELRAELRRLQRERGASFLYATPDFAEALAVADRVVVLLAGAVRQAAAPQDLYDRPVDRDVARFVGAPEINLAPAEYDPAEGGRVRIAGVAAPASTAHGRIFNGARARFEAGLRPEHVLLAAPDDEPDGAPANARVVDSEPLGPKAAITVQTDGGRLRATVAEREAARFGAGAPAVVRFAIDRSLCFGLEDGRRLG
jgi:multiple sugar transport system ATP-binding protein